MTKPHTEEAFETAIVASLTSQGGYSQRLDTEFDAGRALLLGDLLDFITFTQSKPWAKVKAIHGDKLPEVFADALCKAMDQRGSLAVLRHGFPFFGKTFRLVYFAPSHGLNPDVQAKCDANRLSVVRQLHHDPKQPDQSVDLGLFLNGIPIATAELKNEMTGQTVAHAKRQYRFDRDPKAPIFRFKARALVHFAVDTDEAWMTTRLAGAKTFFLPFNKGHGTAKGNPPVQDGCRTSYLWEEVWRRDSMLELVQRFIHLQVEEKETPSGKKVRKETMIFPRYHQLDCVRKLISAAREAGPGHNYLVQHSAGSGKSNSIAWLAHRLAFLSDEQDRPIYDTVVVLTDRRVLDQQLQDTIFQLDHKRGVVEKIDKHSEQLATALEKGAPIIISTIHKFGFIQDRIAALPERRYAIIVDEAHSSQSGEMAVNVKQILAKAEIARKLAEAMDEDDVATMDQLALRAAIARGKQDNLSFFAFTATPKYKTLQVFGHRNAKGLPAPFHVYSMRQAIEERFILDVLKGYTTYSRYFALVKAIADDPDLDKRKAARALVRFVNLHPSNVSQKVEVIVEHFRGTVMSELERQAKAMVVTGSRLQAVRFKLAMDAYITEKGYSDLSCLVAFSGEVHDGGVDYSEPGMNQGIKESELPKRFSGPDYNLLIVANKYQTGFDQPLLCAMYVDKRLGGIQAVQTLSRLNRTHRGKERTFVLDFVNERDDILAAFQQFYEEAAIEEDIDPQRLYELQAEVEAIHVIEPSEVDAFAKVFFKLAATTDITAHARLNAHLDPAVDRFKALDDDEARDTFRGKLRAFVNLYAFLAQIVPFSDPGLEKLYAYGKMLLRKLPRRDDDGRLDLDDEDVSLKTLILKKQAEGDLELEPDEGDPLRAPDETGTGKGKGPKEKLSTIIELINARFGADFDAQDLVDGVTTQLLDDEEVQQAAHANDKANFGYVFDGKLTAALVDRHDKHGDFINAVFSDESVGKLFRSLMLDAVYERLQAA